MKLSAASSVKFDFLEFEFEVSFELVKKEAVLHFDLIDQMEFFRNARNKRDNT